MATGNENVKMPLWSWSKHTGMICHLWLPPWKANRMASAPQNSMLRIGDVINSFRPTGQGFLFIFWLFTSYYFKKCTGKIHRKKRWREKWKLGCFLSAQRVRQLGEAKTEKWRFNRDFFKDSYTKENWEN